MLLTSTFYLADLAEIQDARLNHVLDTLEGYPELDPNVKDIQHGLLNRYRLDYVYHRAMAKSFFDEAIHSLRLYVAQHETMEKKGYTLPEIDLEQLPIAFSETSIASDAMVTDN